MTNVNKYMQNPLNIDLCGYLCSYKRLSMMRKLAIATLFTFCLALTPPAHSQGTFTAASCNRNDVNAVINGPTHTAMNGDTIRIPAGSCTWTSGIAVPHGIGITIVGSGTPNSSASTTGASSSCASETVITDSLTSGSLFTAAPAFGNSTMHISCMKLLNTVPSTGYGSPIGIVGACTPSGCPNLRLDNITAPSSWADVGISDAAFAVVVNMFGVADHNTIGDVPSTSNGVDFINVSHASWQGVGSYGDNSWASPDTFGTNQAFYLENNLLSYALLTDTDTNLGTGGGARWVCRFNTVNNISSGGGCTDHGTDTTGRPRGGHQYEVYRNIGTCTNPQQGCPSFAPGRSGTGMVFQNTFTNSGGGFFKSISTIDAQRLWRGSSPWGLCDGKSPWDTNDGTTHYSGTIGSVSGMGTGAWTINNSGSPGWSANQWAAYALYDVTQDYGIGITSSGSSTLGLIFLCESCISFRPAPGDSYQILRATACMDMPTRGAGQLVQNNGSGNAVLASTGNPGPVNEVLDPIYEWGDSTPGGYDAISSSSPIMIKNRDFYIENINQAAQSSPTSPFNGTSGNGHGTLANRPTTCTPSVGYWATDQGNWNQNGSGEQGELFVCTSTNTWTLYYTPFTYPHPLIAGGSTVTGDPPNPPTSLKVTVQ